MDSGGNGFLHSVLTSRVYDVARETPLDPAPRLSRRLGHTVLLKREDLQPVFSFKLRGAYNKIAHLSAAESARGVITASAGNHAQGVALSARELGLRAVIVMPHTTPEIKVEAVREMGAEVVLAGDSYSDAQAHAEALAAETGLVFVHPFDDPLVIAGQGTIGEEIIRQSHGRVAAVFVPVGGGGLVAGIAGYVKALFPRTLVFGVEPYESDAMYRSLEAGRRVRLDHVGIFADGVAVREVGALPFEMARALLDGVIRVTNDEICAAIKDVFDDTRSLMEPARGLPLAAVLSGANTNFHRLRFVAERSELGEAREALLGVTIPERPGAFRDFCAAIGRREVTEFNYRLSGREEAHIFVGLRTASREDGAGVLARLHGSGYPAVDLSQNEMAKLHVRHLVGGRASGARDERLYRFEFPERPGALLEFLEKLGGRFNISLFHYRNHGADFGRVLAAFEVPAADEQALQAFLRGLGYAWVEETANVAFDLFLSGAPVSGST
jgi:threonine dehydratase